MVSIRKRTLFAHSNTGFEHKAVLIFEEVHSSVGSYKKGDTVHNILNVHTANNVDITSPSNSRH
jgi:hypothetical protein